MHHRITAVALLASAAVASAQSFEYHRINSGANAGSFSVVEVDSPSAGFQSGQFFGPGPHTLSVSGDGPLTADLFQDDTVIDARVEWAAGADTNTRMTATTAQFFSVTEDATLTMTWDDGGLNIGELRAQLTLETDPFFINPIADQGSALGPSGSFSIQLQAGTRYLAGVAVNNAQATSAASSAFVRWELSPAPGAIALLPMAGVLGMRRRR